MKIGKKYNKGITLIALIITIIVLLILAAVSISVLTGENGILKKATNAKTNTEKSTVIELARTDILGQISGNNGETITETQLKTILGKYFEEFNDELPEDLSETNITLTSKTEYGGYTNISLGDIYNGKLKKDNSQTISFSVLKYDGLDYNRYGPFEVQNGTTFKEWINEYHPSGFELYLNR